MSQTIHDKWVQDVLGLTMGTPTPTPMPGTLSDGECRDLILGCGSSWKKVKKAYLTNKPVMQRLVEYRKSVVDSTIRTLDAMWGGRLIAKAVGSTNLTSDYDITFATIDADGSEIDAVVAFNNEIKTRFGVPPGVCFDTNLYVKDFLDVKDKSILGTEQAPKKANEGLGKPIDAIEFLTAFDRSDQDVGALTKQREYMDTKQWEAYCNATLAQICRIPDDVARGKALKETELQFSEAESTFLLKATEKVEALFKQMDAIPPRGADPEAVHGMAGLRERWNREKGTVSAHDLVDKIMHAAAGEDFEAQAMEANNDLYLQKMFAARDVQKQHKELDAILVTMKAAVVEAAGDPDDDPTIQELVLQSDALKTRAKKEITDANYFAAEAYLSEGPLQHIVNGNQGGNADAVAALKPDHLLGSINEQFGDFMKDCGHYADDEGEAFCQTSKYVERMLHGIALLLTKPGYEGLALTTVPTGVIETMRQAIEALLLPIRGAKGEWADKSDEERFAAALDLAPSIYGTGSMSELKTLATGLSVEVNAAVRAAISAGGGMRPGDDENRKFFANRQA